MMVPRFCRGGNPAPKSEIESSRSATQRTFAEVRLRRHLEATPTNSSKRGFLMFGDRRVVDNRVFLLGLDKLFREAMKGHEVGELLPCARRIAQALGVPPADVPVEGYYGESPELTEYFLLVRALQEVRESLKSGVASLPEFSRLLEVVSSPIFGEPISEGMLLPKGNDPLSQALEATKPNWSMESLVPLAGTFAEDRDNFSLVGLAARSRDAVVLTATRESVVLYARVVVGSARRRPRYSWEVDKDLSQAAARFVETFNRLFGDRLPAPKKRHAETYWHACKDNEILGRCVRIGVDDSKRPVIHYHWAIYREVELRVHEFRHPEIWTTARYRSALGEDEERPHGLS